jgi:hypothetical protein
MYGWKNWETWRVKKLFDWKTPRDICGGDSVTPDQLRRRVESYFDMVCGGDKITGPKHIVLVFDFATAALDAVDWEEIAEAINAKPEEEHRTKNRSAELGGPIPMIV